MKDLDLRGFTEVTNALWFCRKRRMIILEKDVLSPEDELILSFSRILDECGVRYVVVAGYITILFGRNRRTDDVDVIVEDVCFERFRELCCRAIKAGFNSLQIDVSSEDGIRRLFNDYFVTGYRLRFIRNGVFIPNVELKKAVTELEKYSLREAFIVQLPKYGVIRISPLEVQIAYKLWLGSDKDIGDARFLYKLFEEVIDIIKLEEWCRRFRVGLEWLE
ncbi:MAG: hypothetical protein DRP08_05990 [Candidatus Aenigmatarchaeota archaeon]|nr:MAG: hypothetical protein DRP08_05990 [Candidatus Aenigmarchaeota archaeon]